MLRSAGLFHLQTWWLTARCQVVFDVSALGFVCWLAHFFWANTNRCMLFERRRLCHSFGCRGNSLFSVRCGINLRFRHCQYAFFWHIFFTYLIVGELQEYLLLLLKFAFVFYKSICWLIILIRFVFEVAKCMNDFLGSGLSCFLLLGHILGFLDQSSVGGEINISGRNGRKWSCWTICYPNFWRNLFSLQLWNVVELADALRRHDWVL